MDALVRATGLGKATVRRLYTTKDELIGAYLQRLSATILAAIDADITRHADEPREAVRGIVRAIAANVARPSFRGCPFNNASIEFANPAHPARTVARDYRIELHRRLNDFATLIRPQSDPQLGARLALLIDGMYANAAHLGPDGPAAAGPELAAALMDATDAYS